MITDIFLQVVLIIAQFLVQPLMNAADVVLPANLTTAIANVEGFWSTVNPVFPLDSLLAVLGILIGVEIAIFAYKGIYWLIKKIPTIS